jgi:hypothetical protein
MKAQLPPASSGHQMSYVDGHAAIQDILAEFSGHWLPRVK